MVTLATLNAQARSHAAKLEDVDWERPIDPGKLWVPRELCPLSYLPVYEALSEEERLADNHIYALSLAEQFVFLEEEILNRVIRALRRDGRFVAEHLGDPELVEALDHLYDEEVIHTEMFWRLCERAAPERYERRSYGLIPLTPLRQRLVAQVFGRPLLFPFWTWVGALFEEKTIYFSRLYESYAEEEMDATFARVHKLHMIDEARHFALEREFVARLWRGLSGWRRKLNLRLFESFLGNFVFPIGSSLWRFDALVRDHPRLAALRPQVKRELAGLPRNTRWLEASFSPAVVPGCFKLFDAHPEVKASIARLLAR